jgi:acetyl-CoA acyltransferase
MSQDVYIVAANRTPVGKARGVLKHIRPDDLLVHALKGILKEVPSVDPSLVEDVIVGCAMPEGEQGMNVARISTLLAGLPDTVPAVTVNRFCASGVQSIAYAADRIASGQADAIIAGGVESMTRVPMGGHHFSGNEKFFTENEKNVGIAYGMGITAEIVAKKWEVSREDQDAFSLESHLRALRAIEKGYFKDEIVPFPTKSRLPNLEKQVIDEIEFLVENDEGPRKGSTIEALAKLRPAFAARGGVTAGNSSQMSDGAACAFVASEKFVKEHNLTPLARFRGFSVAGVPPETMGVGPIEAIPRALKKADLSLSQMDWIELNEAFAAQSLAVVKTLELDPAKVNPQGGAIALGHPLGATGAIRTATLLHGLKRTKGKFGMVTMCIGTGMGACAIFEAV